MTQNTFQNQSPDPNRSLGQRQSFSENSKHDLIGSLRTLRCIIAEIQDGYKFDDTDAPEILDLFIKAVDTLEDFMDT